MENNQSKQLVNTRNHTMVKGLTLKPRSANILIKSCMRKVCVAPVIASHAEPSWPQNVNTRRNWSTELDSV